MKEHNETTGPKEEKRSNILISILNGSIFTRSEVKNQLPYIVTLVFLIIVYIGNRYHAESVLADLIRVQKELKDTRAEWILINSDLLDQKRQSHIKNLVQEKNLGLHPLQEPPKKITLDD